MNLRRVATVASVLLVTVAACSDSERAAAPELFDGKLQEARAAGATDEQIAVLAEAEEAGVLTFEAYSAAVDRALRCMREAGVAVIDDGTIQHLGLRLRSYSVPAEDEEVDQREPMPGITVHRCVAEHSIWVEFAYQDQPASVEARAEHFNQYRDAILDCLANYGVEVDVDASEAMTEAELNAEFQRAGERRDTYGRCLDETGYSR